MSGHSHAKTVKRIKEAGDKKRGQIFSKIARQISLAVREGGPNPENNSKLRLAIEMARSVNMPNENIERAIKRSAGETEAEKLEEVLFEAYGPAGIAVIVEGITDNKNRTLAEIKQTLNQYNGKLAAEGSVKWMFEKRGCITINFDSQAVNFKNKEDLELAIIEAGVEDFYWEDENTLNLYTKIENLDKVKSNLEKRGIKFDSASLDWVAKEKIELDEKDKEICQKFFNALDELESVQETYSNLK